MPYEGYHHVNSLLKQPDFSLSERYLEWVIDTTNCL